MIANHKFAMTDKNTQLQPEPIKLYHKLYFKTNWINVASCIECENIVKMKDYECAKLVSAGKAITPEMEYEIEKNVVTTVSVKSSQKTMKNGEVLMMGKVVWVQDAKIRCKRGSGMVWLHWTQARMAVELPTPSFHLIGEYLLGDAFHVEAETARGGGNDEGDSYNRSSNPNVDKLFVDMKKPLFPGCDTFSVLGFILRLMHVKVTCKMTNGCMDMTPSLLSEAFKDSIIPKTHYEAKKYLQTLGLGYESIHACKTNCALFWKENSELQSCPCCGASRWVVDTTNKKKIPVKVLRYFPITSRLKRLYTSRYTAKDMQWHARNKFKEDGLLRHPADEKAWKHFDTIYPDFSKEPRNVHLGLASDGFNPCGTMSTSYSTWPVVLMTYNMPPRKSMIDVSFMMALLIPDPVSLGKDIDVYLRPLIDELNVLWEKGVETYESRGMIFHKSKFPALSSFSNPNPSTVASNHCPHLPRPVAPVPTSAPPYRDYPTFDRESREIHGCSDVG
ncbi:hypothetical protein LXL04_006338 [Taraxacum kok-saghyz]